MSTLIIGSGRLIVGIKKPLPLRGFPQGKTRIRLRWGEPAVIFIRSAEGMRAFDVLASECGKFWEPAGELAANLNVKEAAPPVPPPATGSPKLSPEYFDHVVKTVASVFQVDEADLRGESRLIKLVHARFAAWIILREEGFMPSRIAASFGRDDAGSVRHGVLRGRAFIQAEKGYARKLHEVMERLGLNKKTAES